VHGRRAVLLGRSLAVALLASACTRHPDTPDAQVRTLLARAEVAAEGKDAAALKPLIADAYRDELGQDKRAVMALLVYTFMHHESIHLLTRIHSVEFPQPAHAEVVAFVAMAGQNLDRVELLASLSADLYRFDFTLLDRGGGDWQVTRARWHPATLDDFQ